MKPFVILALLFFNACDPINSKLEGTSWEWKHIQKQPRPFIPEFNPMDSSKVELGRFLFYDSNLSANRNVACATCHNPKFGFGDSLKRSIGTMGDTLHRNAQPLINVAYYNTFTWMNPVFTTLEDQMRNPLFGEAPKEMGLNDQNLPDVIHRFLSQDLYQEKFAAVFPKEAITIDHFIQSIAAFQRTIVSFTSPYDRFLDGDIQALTSEQIMGKDLFFSEKLECSHCHNGRHLSTAYKDEESRLGELSFFNTGMYNLDSLGSYPEPNLGLFEASLKNQDRGKFRPPTLRNVALTAPYLHDGSVASLEEIIAIYASGGRNIIEGPHQGDGRQNPNKSQFIKGFELTSQETQALLAFLHSLTDTTFLTEPEFQNPFGLL
jgi:cytochrome c peroxidase